MNFFRKFKRNLIYKLKRKINIDQDFFNEPQTLDSLFRHYNCDKGSSFINEKKQFVRGHDYSSFYEKHFDKFGNKKINILEIGVFSGASSASFANYFSKSVIYCIDFNLTNFKFSSKKFTTSSADVSDPKQLNDFIAVNDIQKKGGFFDIVIDDGSHKLSDLIKSFFFFFKYIRKNGIYVMEEYKFPELYSHLDDSPNELKIDKIFDHLTNKKIFSSGLVKKNDISEVIEKLKKIDTYKGAHKGSNIAFIESK